MVQKESSKNKRAKKAKKYCKLSKMIDENTDYSKQVQSVLLKLYLIEVITEAIPQVTTILALILNHYHNDFGQMTVILTNTILKVVGLNKATLCIFGEGSKGL